MICQFSLPNWDSSSNLKTLLQQPHFSTRFLSNISIKNDSEARNRARFFDFLHITLDSTYKCVISHPWIKIIENPALLRYSELKKKYSNLLLLSHQCCGWRAFFKIPEYTQNTNAQPLMRQCWLHGCHEETLHSRKGIQGEECNLFLLSTIISDTSISQNITFSVIFSTFNNISGSIQPSLSQYHHIVYSLILTNIF